MNYSKEGAETLFLRKLYKLQKMKQIMDEPKSKKINLIVISVLVLLSFILLIILPIGPAILIILFPIIPILIYFILRLFMQSTFFKILLTFLIWLLILFLFAGYMYFSITGFVKDAQEKPLYLTFEDQDKILLAAKIMPQEKIPYQIVQKEEIKEGNINLILTEEFFDPIDEVTIQGFKIKKEQIILLIKSDNPQNAIKDLLPSQMKELGLENLIGDEITSNIKILALGLLTYETLRIEGTPYLLNSYKEKKIKLNGEPLSVNIILTLVPENLVKDILIPFPDLSKTLLENSDITYK